MEQCEHIKEAWIRIRIFGETQSEVARDFHRRGITTATGLPWVPLKFRDGYESPREQQDAVRHRKPPWYRGDRIGKAVELIDTLVKENKVPSELRVDEENVRRVACRRA